MWESVGGLRGYRHDLMLVCFAREYGWLRVVAILAACWPKLTYRPSLISNRYLAASRRSANGNSEGQLL